MRRALMVATLFLAMPTLADTKPPAKMEEPMAGKMKRLGPARLPYSTCGSAMARG